MKSTETITEFVHCAEKLRNIANKIDLLVLRFEEDQQMSENGDLGLGQDLNSALEKLEKLTRTLNESHKAKTERASISCYL